MKKFIWRLKSAWHHGKASKYARNGNFEMALKHFQAALTYAVRAGDESSIPLEMECIAINFMRLGDYEQALKYANESLKSYNNMKWKTGDVFEVSANRVTDLIKTIKDMC